jgi:NADH:ubiquinone oxidoreductase subunit 6 (subunit J)
MSLEQVIFALAGAVCIVGAITAATHRDPRVAGAALLVALLSLAVLYAGLAAPAVAAAVILVTLFATVPLVVQLTVPVSRAHAAGGTAVAGLAMLIGSVLVATLAVAIALGEVPMTVSVRSTDGYDVAGLRDLVTGRAAAAAGGSVAVLLAAGVAARAARRDESPVP